jgi:soluble lytic murein transglycosylase
MFNLMMKQQGLILSGIGQSNRATLRALLAGLIVASFGLMGAWPHAALAQSLGGMPDVATPVLSSTADGYDDYSPDTPAALAVIAAREAMNRRQWVALEEAAAQAQGDQLAVYADYWVAEAAVRNTLNPNDVPIAETFLQRYPNTYMADKLRANWIIELAQSGDFIKANAMSDFVWYNKEVRCAKLLARHMTGGSVKADEAIADFAPNNLCWKLFDQLVADGVLNAENLKPVLLDAIEVNHTKTAQRLAGFMLDAKAMSQYNRMMSNPGAWLGQQSAQMSHTTELLATIAMGRLARENLDSADAFISKAKKAGWPSDAVQWARSQLALRGSLNLDARADSWYREAGDVHLSSNGYEWRVRSALRQPNIDWKWVNVAISLMPPDLAQDPSWVYWQARAMVALGQPEKANEQFKSIARGFNFYGQLAAEELGQSIVVPQIPAAITADEINAAQSDVELQTAVALFKHGWRREAVPQWNWAIRGMNDRQLMAAAEFAKQQQIYDRVVNTSDRTREEINFSQRFIAPFEGQVTAQARLIDLDAAWVYGLIRQESRFITDAKSVVGASGLMQLMPATAKWVAKKIGMTDFSPQRVNEFDINTKLGTNYLNLVLNDFNGSQVLASAGYNAGPSRSIRWRATLSQPVEGAIFAETIPFSETRDYVKSVLSNATYYAAIFSGQPQSLKQRLGQIAPDVKRSTQLP